MKLGSKFTVILSAIILWSGPGLFSSLEAAELDVAGATPAFRDPLTRDPMTAKTLSRLATGMGHYYNGNFKKMRKYQRLQNLAMIPVGVGLILDINRHALEGVDQFRDISKRRFPWWTLAGSWITGGMVRWIRKMDQDEAYQDALEGDSPLAP